MCRRQLLELFQRLDPALRLSRLAGLGFETPNEVFHVLALCLLLFERLLLLRQALGTGPLEGRVAPAIERQLALLDVHDMTDHLVEEVAVMGNQHQRARIALEPGFQPEDGVKVEVVGGFVEQQQIRRAHQRLREVQTHPPAAGEAADRKIHLLVGKAQAGQQLARPRVSGITVSVIEFGMQASQRPAVVGGFSLDQRTLNAPQLGIAVQDVIDRQPIERIDLLAHMCNTPVRRQLAIAFVGGEFAAQQGEQAGFTGAVGAYQPDLLARMQGQLGAFQQTLWAAL